MKKMNKIQKKEYNYSQPHQTGHTTKPLDIRLKALLPGKRLSKNGKIYYEYRMNRSDIDPSLGL